MRLGSQPKCSLMHCVHVLQVRKTTVRDSSDCTIPIGFFPRMLQSHCHTIKHACCMGKHENQFNLKCSCPLQPCLCSHCRSMVAAVTAVLCALPMSTKVLKDAAATAVTREVTAQSGHSCCTCHLRWAAHYNQLQTVASS